MFPVLQIMISGPSEKDHHSGVIMKFKNLPIIAVLFFLNACIHKNSPEYITKKYITALKEKNWEEAKKYCDDTAIQNLDCSIRMGYTDFGITEIKNIRCKTEKKRSECKFCCWPDTIATITLHKYPDGKWKVGGVKELCPDEVPHEESDSIVPDTLVE